MKTSWEWNEDDIQTLIDEDVEESVELEYKRCNAIIKRGPGSNESKNEITKDVSALANSQGGNIVYGVIEDTNKLPSELDGGYDPKDKIGEHIEQVVVHNIQPRINGFRVHQVSLDKTSPGKVVYVVHVPQSNTAHMARDKRYYGRQGTLSVPLEDYQVRDVNRRAEAPDLYIVIDVQSEADPARRTSLRMAIGNHSAEPAQYVVISLFFAPVLNVELTHSETLSGQGESELRINNGTTTVPVKVFHLNWGIGKLPIWADVKFHVATAFVAVPSGGWGHLVGWEVKSPRMPVKRQFYAMYPFSPSPGTGSTLAHLRPI